MIVNTKKGGHAFIGLYLAKELLAARHDVTIFNDGHPVCFCQWFLLMVFELNLLKEVLVAKLIQ